MRVLLIQTLALGDLLLDTPLLSAVQEVHPQARITVLAQEAYAEVAGRHPAVERFIPWPGRELAELASQPGPGAPLPGLARLERLERELAPGYEMVINPCFNDPAGALSFLARGRRTRVLGADLSAEGALVMRGDWMAYYQVHLQGPHLNPLHAADILALATGAPAGARRLVFAPTATEKAAGRQMLARLARAGRPKVVALQMGAGKPERSWPWDNWRELARGLLRRGLGVVLTGVAAEAPAADRLVQELGPGVLSAAGATDLGCLAGLLAGCRALVSGDTGTMHVAAAVGLPIVCLSLAGARPRATGPYRPGSLVLEAALDCAPCADPAACSHHHCRRALRPDDVLAALEHLLGEPYRPPEGSRTRVYRSARAADGLLELSPLGTHRDQPALEALRAAWLAVLAGHPAGPPLPGEELRRVAGELAALANQATRRLQELRAALAAGRGSAAAEMARAAAGLGERFGGTALASRELTPLAIYQVAGIGAQDQPDPVNQATGQARVYGQLAAVARRLAGQAASPPG